MSVSVVSRYTVAAGLVAGEYPGASDPALAERRVRSFANDAITTFVDLTHPADGLPSYAHLLPPGARRLSHPIVDFGTTTVAHMTRILDDVDAARAEGGTVYVHCLGGVGRTGMVVGCWLVRHRLDEGDAVRVIRRLRRGLPDAWAASPQTSAQRAIVEAWKPQR